MNFKPLSPKFNLPELEKKVMKYWAKRNVLEKYLRKNEGSSKRFSFIDGPITANNPMGVHHARGRALKDLFQRFKNMQGFKQRFQNGFDCQGLWVEVEVEKSLGFNSKKDIENYGLDKFTEACKQRVRTFAKKIAEQSKRLGYFMDWDNSYFTMSEQNNLHIWAFLKKCYEQGLIYKGKSTTAWCPRCETGLSKHEQADSYKEITDASLYVKFPIKGRKNEFFLAWTTTPWTLPANVLLAINPDLKYVKVNEGQDVFYLVREAAQRLGFNKIEQVAVGSLLGLEYEPLFDDIEAQKEVRHFVVEWKDIDPAEGTGVVHIAPGCGEEDFELGKKQNVPLLSPLLPNGTFKQGYGDLTGEYALSVKEKISSYLQKKNLLFKEEEIRHSYPHCWRCGTKCLFRTEDNWFINCKKIKPQLKAAVQEIDWFPAFVGLRMNDWLENMGDWMISRSRFYGLALPFYECGNCGQLTIVGSKEELKELAVNPEQVDSLPSLHRPWIDRVEIKCPSCGKPVRRILEVGDCWLDAGVVPFSTLHYLTDKAYWKKWFPADLVSEMIEQVRLWYFSMLVYSVILENRAPYKKVVSYVHVRDENGKEMHKSWGNAIPFDEAAEKMGADAMRWLYFGKKGRLPVNFGYGIADDIKNGFFSTLWNCYRYFLGFASLELDFTEKIKNRKSQNILDKWILSKTANLVKRVTEDLENFDQALATVRVEDFVLRDLSLWYIRRSRNRFGPSALDIDDKKDAYATLFSVLETLTKILAPFLPFLTEKLWYSLGNEDSIHTQDWPDFDKGLINNDLESQMEVIRRIASIGHKLRKQAGIRTRQPLSELRISYFSQKIGEELIPLLKEELNVKDVDFMDEIKQEKGWVSSKEAKITVALNTGITPGLKNEGIKRELIRNIQKLRRKAGLTPTDKIALFYSGDKELEEVLIKNEKEIKIAVTAEKLKQGKQAEVVVDEHLAIGDKSIWFGLAQKQ